MRLSGSLVSSLLLLAAGTAQAASSWSFDDATIAVTSRKGADGMKEKLSSSKPLSKVVTLGSFDTAKVILTAKDNGKAKRAHQVFLLLKDAQTGLEAPFPLAVKENGKGVVSITQKDIPIPLLTASKPVQASIVIGSFGSAQGVVTPVFDLEFKMDPNSPAPTFEKPLRYGKQPEIHHIFRADARSPPKVISLFFVLAVLATVPALVAGWLLLGANLNHVSKAMSAAPLSHAAFFGSLVAMEGVFFLYYSSWSLFQTLPVVGLVGAVTVLSGTKALGEVQSRRLAGER